jgi:hypothetical protein
VELSAGNIARQVLHAAVGADHEALRVDVAECGADAFGYELGRLDVHVAEVEDAEDHALRGQLLEELGIEPWLGRLDRDLIRGARVELGEERVAVARLLVDDRGVAEACVQRPRTRAQ